MVCTYDRSIILSNHAPPLHGINPNQPPKPPQQPEGGEAPKPGQLDRKPFKLHVEAGAFTDSEIIVMLGEVRLRSRLWTACVCGEG